MTANHGRVENTDHKLIGRNSTLDSIQAAVLNVKLNILMFGQIKKKIAELYNKNFQKLVN